MSWSTGLIREIRNPKNLIISSELGVVIADKYPKAQHHYLVLPLADIQSIFQLNRSHLPLLDELYLLARNVVEVKGVHWQDFQVGFHAEPSMQRLHLHVISKDFVSPSLKTKKHWNSFNTELFVPYEKLYALLEKENGFSRLPKSLREELLNKPLLCNQCEFVGTNLPTLKEHLLQHLQGAESLVDKMTEKDEKAFFRDELKRKLNDKRNFLIETDRAVVIKADFPKSQYHFRVVVKEELKDVTELTEEHLPLLDHMMELANQIIEQQDHLQSRNFRIGFKVHTFWNRLNLHVLSDDFYSMAMKRARHWNSFNTELFMPFQIVHMLLGLQGSVDPISDEKYNELLHQKPLNCNQCEFSTDMLLDLKAHLFQHWQLKEGEREKKKKLDKIVRLLDEQKLNAPDPSLVSLDDEVASQSKPQVKAVTESKGVPTENTKAPLPPESGYENSLYGPLVNMMNQVNPNNPFRNTPPLNINSLNPAPRHTFNYRHPTFNQNMMTGPHGPRGPWNGPRFPPHQTGFNGFATGPPMQGYPQYQPIGVGGGYGRTGSPNSVRPMWVQNKQNMTNFQYQNNQNRNKSEQKPNLQGQSQQIYQQQKPLTQQRTQGAYPKQQSRPNMNSQNRQHPPNAKQNPQNRQNSNPNNRPNQNSQNHQNPNKQKYKNKKPANQNPQQSSSNPRSQGIQAAQLPSNAKPAGGP